MFEVERNIPVPDEYGGGRAGKYPWRGMDVGDSFHVPSAGLDRSLLQTRMSARAVNTGNRLGTKYTVRIDGDGVRVWRIA